MERLTRWFCQVKINARNRGNCFLGSAHSKQNKEKKDVVQ